MSELYQKQASSTETSGAHQAWFTVTAVTGKLPLSSAWQLHQFNFSWKWKCVKQGLRLEGKLNNLSAVKLLKLIQLNSV